LKYSQRDEQGRILDVFSAEPRGRFLDIGAWNPKTFSNTRALFELGWSGLCIEPSPGPLRDLVKEYGYSTVQILAGAVALESGIEKLAVTDDSVSGNKKPQWQSVGGFYGELLIQHYTIPQILAAFGAFDFVSIDTEGTSVDLLKELLKTQMRPKLICVEYDNRRDEAVSAAREKDYHVLHRTIENLLLIRGTE
jgi:FkbM family methyltransferase